MQRAVALIAVTAGLSGLGVNSSPHPVSTLRRRDMPEIPDYDFAGCYTEADSARALTGSNYFDDQMTIQKCATACSGYKYFGVEYGRECYCGNTLNAGSVETELSECSFTCPGDATQNCGAGNRLDMYIRSPEVTPPPTPTTYSYSGCYAEPADGRALTGQMTASDDMTVEKCASFCGNAGYSHFGLEYYYECYCGNNLAPGAQSAPEADCKFPCDGDATQKCGGDWRLNLFQFGSAMTSASSSISTSSSATPAPSAGVSTYVSEGCYTEATGKRALSDASYCHDTLTVEKCAAMCSTYTWFGLEFGRECYCGNTINDGSVQAPLSDCSFNCPGNSAQKCGAGNRLNMYRYLPATTSSSSPIESSTVSTSEPTTAESSATSSAASSSVESSTTTSAEASTTTSALVESSTVSNSESTTAESSATSSAASSPAESLTVPTTEPTTTESSAPSSISVSSITTSVLTESSTVSTSETSTSAAEPTSLTSTEPTTLITITSSSSSSSSSSSYLSSSSSTSTVAPLPTEAITNGGFEAGPGEWTIKNSAPGALAYSFTNPSDPHGGLQSASVTYAAGASAYQAWFSQPIILRPNKRYLFSGFAKSSLANPGCSISYYIGTANGNQNLKTLATITSANLRPSWTQSTGFYDSTTITQLTFNVRWTCSGAASRTYYVDDLSLKTTP